MSYQASCTLVWKPEGPLGLTFQNGASMRKSWRFYPTKVTHLRSMARLLSCLPDTFLHPTSLDHNEQSKLLSLIEQDFLRRRQTIIASLQLTWCVEKFQGTLSHIIIIIITSPSQCQPCPSQTGLKRSRTATTATTATKHPSQGPQLPIIRRDV